MFKLIHCKNCDDYNINYIEFFKDNTNNYFCSRKCYNNYKKTTKKRGTFKKIPLFDLKQEYYEK